VEPAPDRGGGGQGRAARWPKMSCSTPLTW
jgi:hypothetical protein